MQYHSMKGPFASPTISSNPLPNQLADQHLNPYSYRYQLVQILLGVHRPNLSPNCKFNSLETNVKPGEIYSLK